MIEILIIIFVQYMIFGKYKRILNNQTDSFHVLNKNLTDGLCQDNIIFD